MNFLAVRREGIKYGLLGMGRPGGGGGGGGGMEVGVREKGIREEYSFIVVTLHVGVSCGGLSRYARVSCLAIQCKSVMLGHVNPARMPYVCLV